jgi:hypothetical protein
MTKKFNAYRKLYQQSMIKEGTKLRIGLRLHFQFNYLCQEQLVE